MGTYMEKLDSIFLDSEAIYASKKQSELERSSRKLKK